MNGAYTSLAEWFEYLNADCDYEKWSQYLYERLQSLGVTGGRGIDVGCGSGAFTRAFARFGFDMFGFDNSPAMLAKAEQLSRGVPRVRYGLSDAAKIRVPGGKVDFALCVNDCLNYIPPSSVCAFFRRMHACLRPGGAFLFDVSSAYKLREILADNVFCEDREEVAYLWFNHREADRVEMDITLFVRGTDGRFDRTDEHHTQYIYEQQTLCAAAQEAGFAVRGCEGTFGDAADRTRVNFLCVRA